MATKRWLGGAPARKQVTTITMGGTWLAAETLTVTCGNQDLILTVGSTVTTTQIATELAKLLAATSVSGAALGTGYDGNYGGQEILQFQDFVATSNSNVVTLTGATAGLPFTVTASETSTSGTVSVSTTTAATGPNHADNADNWSGGTLPANGDTMLFDTGAVAVKYGLTYFRTNTLSCPLTHTTDYTGQIGLPDENPAGYPEYREKRLQILDAGGANICKFVAGNTSASNVGTVRLDFASQTADYILVAANAMPNNSTPSLEIYGGTFSTLDFRSGNVKLGDPSASSSAVGTDLLSVGGGGGDVKVSVEQSLATTEKIVQYGGTFVARSGISYSGGGTAAWTVYGGTARVAGSGVRDLIMHGGSVYPGHAAPDDAKVYGGTLDLTDCFLTFGSKKVYLGKGAAYRDPNDIEPTAEIYFVACTPSDVTLQLPANKKITLAAGAAIT